MAELQFSNPTMATATKNASKKKKTKKKAKKKSKSKTKQSASKKARSKGGSMAKKKKKTKKKAKKKSNKNTSVATNKKPKKRKGGKKRKTKKKKKSRRNPAGVVSRATSALKSQPKSLGKSALPILAAVGINRIDDLFSDKITGLVNVEKDSAAGKGIRVVGAILLGVAIDAVMGRKKQISWSWGEFGRNLMLINIGTDVLAQDIEPRMKGEAPAQIPAPAAPESATTPIISETQTIVVDDEGNLVVLEDTPASSPTGGTQQQVAGMNGMGRSVNGMGAFVRVPPPVFL